MDIKENVEKFILRKIGKGSMSFWWGNWSGKGALAKLIHYQNAPRKILVNNFFDDRGWIVSKLKDALPNKFINDIIGIEIHGGTND